MHRRGVDTYIRSTEFIVTVPRIDASSCLNLGLVNLERMCFERIYSERMCLDRMDRERMNLERVDLSDAERSNRS